MKIHVHIGHPADVHFFRHAVAVWKHHGHTVHLTTRDIPVARRLLDAYGLEAAVIGRKRSGAVGLAIELLEHILRLTPRFRAWNLDASVSFGGTFTVHAARLARCRALVFYDTECARAQNRITYPFAHAIATPAVYPDNLGTKQVRFNGFKELAYLSPSVFHPDPSVLAKYDLSPDTPYGIVRYIAWQAGHDIGVRGLPPERQQWILKRMETALGRVWLIPEGSPAGPLAEWTRSCRPEDFHHLLYYARCVVSEGATTAAEAAVLGTPALYINPLGRSYLDRIAAYGLVRHTRPQDFRPETLDDLFRRAADPAAARAAARRLLADHDDIPTFVARFVERYDPAKPAHPRDARQKTTGA